MATANLRAVISAQDNASGTIANVGGGFKQMAGAMALGQLAANAISKAISFTIDKVKEMTTAAFNQVREVENATFALKAYEKNGTKVNKVLKDLISFARSDPGVLFQREDLFAAASTLKLYGQETDSLVGKVKILARGVALGKTTFQELSQIVGRAAAKGRLDAVDFDMLIERGIGLDRSFRGAAVTSESLFKALEKALPAEILEGRANTIDGLMIRLNTAFRDLGSAILGVDKETTTFIEGGLGDTFVTTLKELRDVMASPAFTNFFAALGNGLANVVPPLVRGMIAFFSVLSKVSEFINIPFRQALQVIISLFRFIKPALQEVWSVIQNELVPAVKELWANLGPANQQALKSLGVIIGVAVVGAILLLAKALVAVIRTITFVINIVNRTVAVFRSLISTSLAVGQSMYSGFMRPIYQVISIVGQLVRAFVSAMSSIRGAVAGMGGAIIAPFKSAFDWIIARVGEVRSAVSSVSGAANSIKSSLNPINAIKGIFGKASGTDFAPGGMTLVGERGPEMVTLPRGSKVHRADETRKMGGGHTTINITVPMMTGSANERRKIARQLIKDIQDVAASNGMSATDMLGSKYGLVT